METNVVKNYNATRDKIYVTGASTQNSTSTEFFQAATKTLTIVNL